MFLFLMLRRLAILPFCVCGTLYFFFLVLLTLEGPVEKLTVISDMAGDFVSVLTKADTAIEVKKG